MPLNKETKPNLLFFPLELFTPDEDWRLYLLRHCVSDVDPRLGPQKENTEHRLEVRKIYQQKVTKDSVRVSKAYYPVVSNIGNRTWLNTTSTPANTTVLRYCSLRVLSHIVI